MQESLLTLIFCPLNFSSKFYSHAQEFSLHHIHCWPNFDYFVFDILSVFEKTYGLHTDMILLESHFVFLPSIDINNQV